MQTIPELESHQVRIAIFASGTGTNAKKIIEYFQTVPNIDVVLLISNKPGAGVLKIAQRHGIDTYVLERKSFYRSEQIVKDLQSYQVNLIVLAGFLWLIPAYLVDQFQGRMLNIHPALLPKYGGKGMYGMHVHQAVKQAGEEKSGITIHEVNKEFDDGNIVFQATCQIDPQDEPDDIRAKVQRLEHQHFAPVIEAFARRVMSNK